MIDRVRRTIARYGMIAPAHKVGVAVSGGADSVCLLHVLRDLGFSLAVVHLNHRLRGDASDADADFVAALAHDLHLELHTESVDVRAIDSNIEQAGREARRALFARLIASGAVDRIATGHTRSDQAETVLYRLFRGAGTAGLSGIAPVTRDGIVRPLLDCTRDEVRSWLLERRIPWREDATNAETAFVRNRIRHVLMPALRQDFSPALPDILAATADVARDEESYWTEEIARRARDLFTVSADGPVILDVRELNALHPAVARRVIRAAITAAKGDLRSIDIAHVDGIRSLGHQAEGHGRLQVPGLDVMRSFEWLRIAPPRLEPRSARNYAFPVEAHGRTILRLPGPAAAICLEFQEEPQPAPSYNGLNGELDADRLSPALELRNWYPGDAIERVAGRRERLKLLFQNGRVPLWERQTWPVLVSGGDVVWTRRFGVAAAYARNARTVRVLHVSEVASENIV